MSPELLRYNIVLSLLISGVTTANRCINIVLLLSIVLLPSALFHCYEAARSDRHN